MDEYAIFPCEWPIDYPEDDPTDKANATDPLTLNDYQRMARRTAGTKLKSDKMEEALFGLAGEVGELCDHYKKYMHQGHDIDYDHMAEEAGDVMWYLAEIADALDVTLEDIARVIPFCTIFGVYPRKSGMDSDQAFSSLLSSCCSLVTWIMYQHLLKYHRNPTLLEDILK